MTNKEHREEARYVVRRYGKLNPSEADPEARGQLYSYLLYEKLDWEEPLSGDEARKFFFRSEGAESVEPRVNGLNPPDSYRHGFNLAGLDIQTLDLSASTSISGGDTFTQHVQLVDEFGDVVVNPTAGLIAETSFDISWSYSGNDDGSGSTTVTFEPTEEIPRCGPWAGLSYKVRDTSSGYPDYRIFADDGYKTIYDHTFKSIGLVPIG